MTYFAVITDRKDYYLDIADLGQKVRIFIPIRIFNNTNLDLYFKLRLYEVEVNGNLYNPSDQGYYDYEQELGAISPGTSKITAFEMVKDVSNISTFPYTEKLYLQVAAYAEDTYSTLVDQETFIVNFTYVNHKASNAIIIEKWDFDDGTNPGFEVRDNNFNPTSGYCGLTDGWYYSAPYGLNIIGPDNAWSYLVSPEYPAFTPQPGEQYFLSFKLIWNYQGRGHFEKLEVSYDNGNTWTQVDTLEYNWQNFIELKRWYCLTFKIPMPEGQTVNLKWRIHHYLGTYDDYAIDDVVLFKY